MLLKILYIALLSTAVFFVAEIRAEAMEGHDHNTPAATFRVEGTEFSLKLVPDAFTEGSKTRVILSLQDPMTGEPVYDAEIYIKFDKDSPMDHSSHPTDHMKMQMGSGQAEGSLDFGDDTSMPHSAGTTPAIDLSLFRRLQPQQMAGAFAVDYPFPEKGNYLYTIAVKSLRDRQFPFPLTYGGRIAYDVKSKAPFYRIVFVILLIILSAIIGGYILYQRRSAGLAAGQKMNLLDIPWLKRFFRSAWFQPVFQAPVLAVFLVIIAAGLFDIQQGDRNIATLLMWTIWWAAIIFTFVFIGRIWCMMCPFGAIQDWIGRLKSMNRDFPGPLRNIYLSSGIFFVLTWWDSYSGIVNKPALTSWLLIGFFAVASGMALVFKGRSFCRYVCPIGGLIGIYSMFSPVELRNKCLETCRGHKVKECMKGSDTGRPCPMFETPLTLDRNNYCNFCSECIKSCSQDNIVVRTRSFAKDLWVSAKGYLDESLLAMVLVGITIIVTGEMVGPWHGWMDTVARLLPFESFGIISHAEREEATYLFVLTVGSLLIPTLLLLLFSSIVRRTTGPESPLSLKRTFIQFSYMFIPVGLSMHLAHNINHLFREGPGIVPAVQRLVYNAVGGGQPDWTVTPLMGAESIFWLQMAIICVMNIFSLYAGYRIALRFYGDKAVRAFIPMAILAVFFMAVNAYILGQPMAMRHTHGGM
ncbi:MAG: 4Fe-4S binding protein [Nitrospiraceae bacterium]|nr:4Fe-4S binding protein [Nitrospiraceae bacterium]